MTDTAKSGRALAIFVLACLSESAASQQPLPFHPTPAEMPLLPAYCVARFAGNTAAEYHSWEARLGPGMLALHHYCAGLNYLNRYRLSMKDPFREYYLSRVVPEMNYTFEKVGSDFPLLGVMHFNRGRAHVLGKNIAAAVDDFNRAIKADPKNGDSYVELSKILEATNQRKEALDTVTKGLQRAPGNAALQKRFIELGGKP